MYTYNARVVKVVDGDTFDATVDLGFKIYTEQRFRVAGLDTPETFKPSSPEEFELGKKATIRAKELLEGKIIQITTFKSGASVYGRFTAKVTLPDGKDFTEVMILEGFGVRYAKE